MSVISYVLGIDMLAFVDVVDDLQLPAIVACAKGPALPRIYTPCALCLTMQRINSCGESIPQSPMTKAHPRESRGRKATGLRSNRTTIAGSPWKADACLRPAPASFHQAARTLSRCIATLLRAAPLWRVRLMDCTLRWADRRAQRRAHQFARRSAAAVLFGGVLLTSSHADSTLRASTANAGPLTASAHLNFRITVLPSLALSSAGPALRAQGNSGVLTLQRSQLDESDGRAPVGSAQLRPHRQVVDVMLRTSSFGGSNLITIASP